MLRLLPRRYLARSVASAYRWWPLAAAAIARAFTGARLDDLILQRRAVNAVHYEEALRRCHVPTLCLVGDHLAFAVDTMRRVHAAIPGSEFGTIPDSFDPSSLCQPEEFTARLETWFGAHAT